jgi:telomere length regulation protein
MKSSSTVIEEFFKNQYSVNQRYAMLNALALGSRDMASSPIPSSEAATQSNRSFFPSKKLSPVLHRKYITAGDCGFTEVQHMLDIIRCKAIDGDNETNSANVPGLVRQRQLRIRRPAKVSEVTSANITITPHIHTTKTTFTEVAAEFFIAPLVNRFWQFLRDEQAREERTAYRRTLHRYHGAGTGLILNAIVLSRFLTTLAILVYTSRNAPEWLAVVAPDALELAVTIGTRPVARRGRDGEDEDTFSSGQADGTKGKEASVLTAALDLALVVLDGCLDLDGGHSLSLDHTILLMGAGEWAGRVFTQLEQGSLMEGAGATEGVKLGRAASGVLLKVDEMTSKWGRSMVVR